jgi:NADH:ubiquinone oxidoreductase subunit 6 (subunit J)
VLFEQILFFIAAILALGGALGVVLIRNPFYSVLALVAHLIALALLFLLLRAEFLAAAQIVVYAGAVMVLYVFVVAYIGGADEPLGPTGGAVARLGPLFAGVLLLEIGIAVVGSGLSGLGTRGVPVSPGFGSPEAIGGLLLQRFLVPFEGASFLLLVAAVGAVVLARRRRGLPELGVPTDGPIGTALGGPGAGPGGSVPADQRYTSGVAGVAGGPGTARPRERAGTGRGEER